MSKSKSALHWGKVRASNYLKLTLLEWDLHGNHVEVSGPNGAGKTSSLAFLKALITGKHPAEPIKKGTDQADLYGEVLDADGDVAWKIQRSITSHGETLELIKADGTPVKKKVAQSTLDTLGLPACFAPGDWINKEPKHRLGDFLRICKIKAPVDDVKRITGEDIPAGEDESAASYLEGLVAERTGVFFIRRTEANKQRVQKAKALEEFQAPVDDGEVPVDVSKLLEERTQLDKVRQQRFTARVKEQTAQSLLSEKSSKLVGCKAQLTIAQKRVEQLEAELVKARADVAEADRLVKLGEKVLPDIKKAADEATAALTVIADPTKRLLEIDKEIADAERNREALSAKKQTRETRERLLIEADAAKTEHGCLDRIVDELRELQKRLLNGKTFGIDGVSVVDGDLRLDDVPFSQGSKARQTEVAIDLACLENPELKILILDDFEKFDRTTSTRILKRAESRGFQCALARVDPDATGLDYRVVIAHYFSENGVAS